MLKRRLRRANPFAGRNRPERAIVYGGQVWAYVVLSLLLAALTSPLWLVSPPEFMGTRQQFRIAGASFWFAVTVIALMAGRSWGLQIVLQTEKRIVSRELHSPWSVKVVWSHPGDQVARVALSVNPEGVARVEAWFKSGSVLLIEKGVNEADLRTLGTDIAACWGVPFEKI